jgi:hypothetical protein
MCLKLSSTPWAHLHAICAFIVRSRDKISALDLAVPHEIFWCGLLIGPVFHLATDFESGKLWFYMWSAWLDALFLEMDDLAQKYGGAASIRNHCMSIKCAVVDRFEHNRDLEAIPDSMTIEGRIRRGEMTDESDLSTKRVDIPGHRLMSHCFEKKSPTSCGVCRDVQDLRSRGRRRNRGVGG